METKIEIERSKVIEMYARTDNPGKMVLSMLFGKEIFVQNIMERVKSFEDACSINGEDPLTILPYPKPVNADQENTNAFVMIKSIAKALNENWVADYSDGDQAKWYPVFEWKGSGVGFSLSGYGYDDPGTNTGSRLCYASSKLSDYAGTQFIDIYNKFLKNNKQ